jgi:hypothetical protein
MRRITEKFYIRTGGKASFLQERLFCGMLCGKEKNPKKRELFPEHIV